MDFQYLRGGFGAK